MDLSDFFVVKPIFFFVPTFFFYGADIMLAILFISEWSLVNNLKNMC